MIELLFFIDSFYDTVDEKTILFQWDTKKRRFFSNEYISIATLVYIIFDSLSIVKFGDSIIT